MHEIENNENNYIQKNINEEEPIAILNLEIEKDVVKQIKLYKNSNPEEVSFAFCKDNNLDFLYMNRIKNEVESLMQNYVQPPNKEKNTYSKDNYTQKNNKNLVYKNNILNNDEYNSYQNINQSKNNAYNNSDKNNRKLFFYQFLQQQKGKQKSKSVNKFKINVFNTIKNTKKKNNIKRNYNEYQNLRNINDSYLTKKFKTINNDNSYIFNRLYNDAKIKRVAYKRPCHYGSQSKENNIFQDYKYNAYETINGKIINKKTLDMDPSYTRSYQIKPHQLLNKECSFQPNLIISNQSNYNTNNNKSYHLNSTHNSNNMTDERGFYSQNNILKTNKLNEDTENNNYYNNNNFILSKNKNNMVFEENYLPLKDKTKYFSNVNENNEINNFDNIELCDEALNNLFILLTGDNQILNKNTININNIDNNSVNILSPLILDINNNEIELNSENFVKRMNNELSIYDKKYIILNYNTSSINKHCNSNYNKQKFSHSKKNKNSNIAYNSNNKYSKNKYKPETFFNYNKNYRLFSGTEKKKNFYYL